MTKLRLGNLHLTCPSFLVLFFDLFSETGRIRFRRVRFQTPNSVSFLGLTEFRGENSVSSSQPIICVQKRTHRVYRRTHRVRSSETVLSKQYSARFLFLGCSRFFWDFPDLLGDGPRIFPNCPFLFLGLLRAPTRNSPERVRDTIWTFPEKSGKHSGLETPRLSFSQRSARIAWFAQIAFFSSETARRQ